MVGGRRGWDHIQRGSVAPSALMVAPCASAAPPGRWEPGGVYHVGGDHCLPGTAEVRENQLLTPIDSTPQWPRSRSRKESLIEIENWKTTFPTIGKRSLQSRFQLLDCSIVDSKRHFDYRVVKAKPFCCRRLKLNTQGAALQSNVSYAAIDRKAQLIRDAVAVHPSCNITSVRRLDSALDRQTATRAALVFR